jgi:hypothetical protein
MIADCCLQKYVHLCARLECKSLNILQKNMRLQLFLTIATSDISSNSDYAVMDKLLSAPIL